MAAHSPLKRNSAVSLPALTSNAHPFPSSKPRQRATLFRSTRVYRLLIVCILLSTLSFLLSYHFPSNDPDASPTVRNGSLVIAVYIRKLYRRALRLYLRQLHLHPLPSRAISAGVIFFIADCSAQLLNASTDKSSSISFSLTRLIRYSLYGFFIMGPFLYLWYGLMNEYGPEDDLRGSILKCMFEQVTLEPMCISMYIMYEGIVCQRGFRAAHNKLRSQFLPLWVKNAMFWLPANFANYYIGTPDLRVVFANLCSLFWNVYFSAKVNKIASASLLAKGHDEKFLPVTTDDVQEDIVSKSRSAVSSFDAVSRRSGDVVLNGKTRLMPS